MRFGICLDGCENSFEHALRERLMDDQPFVFMEIGVAGCDTFLSVCRLLSESQSRWRAIAIDPSKDAFESYLRRIAADFDSGKVHFFYQTREQAFGAEKEQIGSRLDFVFLDGCHSETCVIGDFMAVEPLVVSGGLVVFHDLEDEPGDFQAHCNAPRGVREGLEELGLWKDARPGWKRLPDWQCDKTKNAFSCGVFTKL